ncbi:MAG: hypothetical protein U9N33_05685 [Campylobacterota bacterium]|nr:hypothetical protein [Campylobacterota bacterium]
MSLHIMYDHQCSRCEAFYIPYEEGIVCPNCGLDEDEVNDIVPQLANSANYQMDMHGFYTPIAWWTGSFGDHVALLIFKVLDKFYAQEEKGFKEIAKEHFNSSDWGTQQYMKNHIRDLSYKVYLAIEKQKSITK